MASRSDLPAHMTDREKLIGECPMADLPEIDALLARVPEGYAAGPWSWNPAADSWTVYDGTGERVFEVMLDTDNFDTPAESPEDRSNARLAALAPDLVTALRALRAEVERQSATISDLTRERDEAREALGLAEVALVDLGACDNPTCTEPSCLRALPAVRAALSPTTKGGADAT